MGVGEGYSMRSWYMVYVEQIMRFTQSTEHAVFVRSAEKADRKPWIRMVAGGL